MKHIGYTTADKEPTTWGKGFPAGPIKLYIPEPGVRENIDADRWQHVGWINTDSGADFRRGRMVYHVIYKTHEQAGEHGRPAYIERTEPVPMFRDTPPDHMDVRRSEFNALKKDLGDLAKVVVELTRRPEPASAAPMTFYDHAFIAAWSELKRDYPEMQWLNRIERAHDIAGRLTFHRSPKT